MILSYTLIFTHIAASNAANDNFTNHVTHRIDLSYSYAQFIVEIREKYSLSDSL